MPATVQERTATEDHTTRFIQPGRQPAHSRPIRRGNTNRVGCYRSRVGRRRDAPRQPWTVQQAARERDTRTSRQYAERRSEKEVGPDANEEPLLGPYSMPNETVSSQ